jgi:tetratricopeptide (TPR) repeat protein
VPSDKLSEIDALSVRADAYFYGGLADKAIPLYAKMLQIDPDNRGALWHEVIASAWAIQPDRALDEGDKFLKRFGEEPEMHNWMGLAYQELREFDAAKVHYDRAIDLFGENSNEYVYLYSSMLYRQLGDTAKAVAQLNEMRKHLRTKLGANPSNFRMEGLLASCNAALGEYGELDAWVAQTPSLTDDWTVALLLCFLQGQPELAHRICGKIIDQKCSFLMPFRFCEAAGIVGPGSAARLKEQGCVMQMIEIDSLFRARY